MPLRFWCDNWNLGGVLLGRNPTLAKVEAFGSKSRQWRLPKAHVDANWREKGADSTPGLLNFNLPTRTAHSKRLKNKWQLHLNLVSRGADYLEFACPGSCG